MNKKVSFLFIVFAALLSLAMTADAGVKTAAKKTGKAVKSAAVVTATTAADSNFVGALTHSGEGFAVKPPVALIFLANHSVYGITSRLKIVVGVDVRSEYGFASGFGNVGIGGGLSYGFGNHFVGQVGYARDILGTAGSPNRLYVGVGFRRKV